jgi:hypothetical protein
MAHPNQTLTSPRVEPFRSLVRAEPVGAVVLACVAAAWTVVLAIVASHQVFVTIDSVSNYGHIWYVADQLWHHGRIPLHMPLLGHAQAYAFPYGFVPWMTAAIAWPLAGEHVVALWLVGGFVLLVAAMFWAFPEARRPWIAVALLVEPVLIMVPLKGQMPFCWALAFLFVAIGLWRRDRRWGAAVLCGLAQLTHAPVLIPMVAVLVVVWSFWEPDRRALFTAYAVSLLIALPAIAIVLTDPVTSDAGARAALWELFITVALRAVVLACPFAALYVIRPGKGVLLAGGVAVAILLNLLPTSILDTSFMWSALGRRPDPEMATFAQSPEFQPDQTYRVMRLGDGKVGMYQMLTSGARLDSEFFPESQAKQNFASPAAYAALLRRRKVDQVVIFDSYDKGARTNEHATLEQLASDPQARCDASLVGVQRVASGGGSDPYDVYAIQRTPSPPGTC